MQGQQLDSSSANTGERAGDRASERPVEQSLSFLDVIALGDEAKQSRQSKQDQGKAVASPGSAKAPPEVVAAACPSSA